MLRRVKQKGPSGMPPLSTDSRVEAEEIVQNFHQGVFRPRPGDIFIEGSMKAEENRYRFTIRLRHVAVDKSTMVQTESELQWAAPGQVQVAYFSDSAWETRDYIQFQIGKGNGQKTAYFTTPDMSSPPWKEFLVVGLKFGADTIKYYNPGPTASEEKKIRTIPKTRTVHFEIRDKPNALPKREYLSRENYGYDVDLAALSKPSRSLGESGVVTRQTTTSPEGIKLCCTFQWKDTEKPEHGIVLHYLHDGEKERYWPWPRKLRAHVEYRTEREHFRNKQAIRPEEYEENGQHIRALDCHGVLKDKRWNEYINVRIIFVPGTILDPPTIFEEPKEAEKEISFYFPFSSESIRGKTATLNRLPRRK